MIENPGFVTDAVWRKHLAYARRVAANNTPGQAEVLLGLAERAGSSIICRNNRCGNRVAEKQRSEAAALVIALKERIEGR
jgi:hypothetical protein